MRGKQEKGITLIALVVTIIVLIILAGVSINLILGDNGIITKAKKGKVDYVKADISEKLQLAIADLQMEKLGEATLEDITQEWIKEKIPDCECKVSKDEATDSKIVVLEKDGTVDVFIIDELLNITKNEEKVKYFYDIIREEGDNVTISISFFSDTGINKIEFPREEAVNGGNQKQIRDLEYTLQKKQEYIVKVTLSSGEEQDISILIKNYYNVILKLQEGISIDNQAKKVVEGDSYQATISIENSEYFLDVLEVKMNGEIIEDVANVNIATGNISIPSISGDIEISATKNVGTYIVKNGHMLNSDCSWSGAHSAWSQEETYLNMVPADQNYSSGFAWQIDSDGSTYKKVIFRLSSPNCDRSPGFYLFAGVTPPQGGTASADASFGSYTVMGNDQGVFSDVRDFRFDLENPAESFYVGCQGYWRSDGYVSRTYHVYDVILVK